MPTMIFQALTWRYRADGFADDGGSVGAAVWIGSVDGNNEHGTSGRNVPGFEEVTRRWIIMSPSF